MKPFRHWTEPFLVKCRITCLKENLNASRPSGHPPVSEKDVKRFRWDHNRLQSLRVTLRELETYLVNQFPMFSVDWT